MYLDEGAEDNVIGGTDPGAGNLISGVNGAGIFIAGAYIDYGGSNAPSDTTNSNTIEGNLIGTDLTGIQPISTVKAAAGPYFAGIGIYLDTGTTGNVIGGTTAAARNIISGNAESGVFLDGASNNTIEGNYIGVDVTGSKALGNGQTGIKTSESNNNIIGGATPGAGNVISGNGSSTSIADSSGVDVIAGSQNVIQGNDIGTDAAGTTAIGNLGDGVTLEVGSFDNTIGGNLAGAGNVIAYNLASGVDVVDKFRTGSSGGASTGNTVRRNAIFSNGGLGIDLGDDGVTANDPQDPDINGGNDLQNFPVLVTATSTGSGVTVAGTFNSLPGTNFTLDFYANATVGVNGTSQGKQYVGSVGVITDASGNATINSTFNVAIGSNKYITATATNESTSPYGDTSEFSQAIEAAAQPVTPPPVTTTPVVTLTTPTNGSSTNNNKPTFSGSAGTSSGDSSTVTIKIYSGNSASGTLVQTLTTTASNGNYSVAPTTALPDGTFTAVASQSNSDGNTGTSSPITFTVDTVAPAITLTTPANGSSSINTTPTFSGAAGTAAGDSSTISVNIYSGNAATGTRVETLTTTASNGNYSVASTAALANGTYTAIASQSNSNGNIGTSAADTFTVAVAAAPSGSLSGSASTAASSYNLTALGTSDWAAYGVAGSASGFDHKATGNSQISNVTRVGSGSYSGYTDDTPNRNLSWTDGTPQASNADDRGFLYANNTLGAGCSFTAPADTTSRTIYIFLGGYPPAARSPHTSPMARPPIIPSASPARANTISSLPSPTPPLRPIRP